MRNLAAEFVEHSSIPQSKIGKHLHFINAIITFSEAVRPIFSETTVNAFRTWLFLQQRSI